MKTLMIILLLTISIFSQSFDIVKEKYEGNGMNARVTILVKYDNTYYIGTGIGQMPMSRTKAILNAEWKIKNTPNDSVSIVQIKHLFR